MLISQFLQLAKFRMFTFIGEPLFSSYFCSVKWWSVISDYWTVKYVALVQSEGCILMLPLSESFVSDLAEPVHTKHQHVSW